LEIKNRQLEQLRTGAEGKLNLTEKELERIGMELEKTWRISRQFILDQIISKVTEHVPILKTELRISYFPMQHPTLWGFPSGVRVPSKWGLPKDEFLHDFEMFAHEKSLNGMQFVLNEFDSQIFKLLPEDQRSQLQNKIRKFIEENNEIFLTYPYGDLKLYSKMLDASQYFLKDGFGDPSFPEKRVTEKEIKEQGKVFETAKLDVNNELERVHKIRVVLHSALDRMHLEVID